MFNLGQVPYSFNARPAHVNVDINPDSGRSGRRQYEGEDKMGSVEDKVGVTNIFERGGSGGGGDGLGGLGAAAMVAALGGRNERGMGGDGFGFGGGGGLGALLAIALLGGRGGFGGFGGGFGGGPVIENFQNNGGRGGFPIPFPVPFPFPDRDRGHDHGCCEQLGQQVILSKLGSIEGAIPLAAANTTNDILAQTNALQGALASLALGSQQGFSNVKDSVQISTGSLAVAIAGTKDAIQNGLFLTNTNLLEGLCSVKQVVVDDGEKTRALLVSRFQLEDQTRIASQAAEIIELRNDRDSRGRHADLELKITNTNTAVAAQQQAQSQFQLQDVLNTVRGLVPCVNALINESQIARATNANLIVGSTGVLTGAQTANPTNVRA